MSLEEQLTKMREGFAKQLPEDKATIMSRATQDLRDSGIIDHVIKVGDIPPPFTLQNADGATIRSADLTAQGAVVLTVFRGHW